MNENAGRSSREEAMIAKRTLCDQIYERIKSDIIHQHIAFGEKLVNREFQKRFGVSSTPIRDAINRLNQDGLVEAITNTGARVITMNLDFVVESSVLMSILSRGALDLIIQHDNLGALSGRLESVVSRHSKIHTVDEYVQLDKEFHQAFFDCCGNRQLSAVFEQRSLWMEILVRLASFGRSDQLERLREHEQILAAARCNDVVILREEVAWHYEKTSQWFATHEEVLNFRQPEPPEVSEDL